MLKLRIAAILLTSLSANCMTIMTLGNYQERFEPVVYSGVRSTIGYEAHAHNIFGGLIQTLAYIDLPFSLVLDTAVLPVTIPLALIGSSDDRTFERKGNDLVRLMLPEELKLLVAARQHAAEQQRAFLPDQEGIASTNPDYKLIRLPVRLLEKGVPGCYLHCAASAPQGGGLIPLGIIGGAARSSVGLIRVPGFYKRNEWFRHPSHQSCRPDATGKVETVAQSADLASLCNRTFPACDNSCVAANHEYTLYYVNAASGTVVDQ